MSARRIALVCTALLGVAATSPGRAREVAFPLTLDHEFLRQRIVEELFRGPDESSEPIRDASGCSEVVLSQPTVSGSEDRLRLRTRFAAKLGAGTAGWCFGVTRRSGILEADLAPRLRPGLAVVEFRVVDSRLFGPEGASSLEGALWDWVKPQVHPRLETLRVDLRQPIAELEALLPLLLFQRGAARASPRTAVISLFGVSVAADALRVGVRLDVPEPPAAPRAAPRPEPAWTPEEIARWESAWQSWDAFLTFVVKHGGRDGDEALRRDLVAVLLDARYQLVTILAEPEATTPDPVRPLFLDTWQQLAPVLRRLSARLPGASALQYVSFIAAADAVAALEQLGPEYGVELSTDGLRRMARMIEPAPLVDPTAYDEAIDPELRALFGFGPAPAPAEETPAQPEAPPPPTPPPTGEEAPLSRRSPGFALELVRGEPEPDLDRWIPSRRELPAYLDRVREVLLAAALRTQRKEVLPARHAALYRNLMLATAWQESCWRQFTRRGGALQPLTSSTGALGIMQVNPHVWRGFYEVASLRKSMKYNAVAGSEILHHYLVDYAIARHEDEVRGRSDDLARAAYSAYNAGPRRLDRYRRGWRSRVGHPIDTAFFDKYTRIRDGDDLAVVSCFPGLGGSA